MATMTITLDWDLAPHEIAEQKRFQMDGISAKIKELEAYNRSVGRAQALNSQVTEAAWSARRMEAYEELMELIRSYGE